MKAPLYLIVATLFAFLSPALRANNVDEWITKARSYLGSEQSLDAVNSVRITGTIHLKEKVPSPDDKSKLVEREADLPIEIIFRKPYQQRITITRPEVIMVDGLDGYDAWQKRIDPKNPAKWQLSLLDNRGIKNLRANTWENLNFYRGLEQKGGTVTLDGEESVDGIPCVKMTFRHDESLAFKRYIDKKTGRLVKTVTENGTEIREEGSITANGVRYPKKITNRSPNGDVTTINFETVVLNEQMPDSLFMVPTLEAN